MKWQNIFFYAYTYVLNPMCLKSHIGLITARTMFGWILLYGHLMASWDLELHIVLLFIPYTAYLLTNWMAIDTIFIEL